MIEVRSPKTAEQWQAYYDLRYRILRAPSDKPREVSETKWMRQGPFYFVR